MQIPFIAQGFTPEGYIPALWVSKIYLYNVLWNAFAICERAELWVQVNTPFSNERPYSSYENFLQTRSKPLKVNKIPSSD